MKLYVGDCREIMKDFPDNSIDAIVTDPPYELGFMGKGWDKTGIANDVTVWRECLRVLKPGGHLLSFGGTRTYHRMACAVEDAGFEVRDQIMWIYSTGFPKSLDVSKEIDKAAGVERQVVGVRRHPTLRDPNKIERTNTQNHGGNETRDEWEITEPATEDAKQWQGWGTALKPAHEPIVLARKPLAGKVAANVLKHGTGALNIDACRVDNGVRVNASASHNEIYGQFKGAETEGRIAIGRWPANLIHDGSAEVVELFPVTASGAMKRQVEAYEGDGVTGFLRGRSGPKNQHGDSGSAARFFYCAKASKKDRDEGLEDFEEQRTGAMQATADGSMLTGSGNERTTKRRNIHPTVKPTDLMRYLCRLITPPGGVVLDPFMGSGSTGKAAILEGFDFIGIELSSEYVKIAEARIGQ